EIQHGLDLKILATIALLTSIGLILVYDVSVVQAFKDFGDKYYYIKQQAIWVALGFFCLWFFSVFDYHLLRKFALPVFLTSFLMLLLVQFPGFGTAAGGAHRWLRLGAFSIQPAEIIK